MYLVLVVGEDENDVGVGDLELDGRSPAVTVAGLTKVGHFLFGVLARSLAAIGLRHAHVLARLAAIGM